MREEPFAALLHPAPLAERSVMIVVRFGIIGCGYMGRTYAACLARHTSGTRLVAVTGGSRAPTLAAEFGVDVAPAVEALVSRPDDDAVIIASPHSAHPWQVQAADAYDKTESV